MEIPISLQLLQTGLALLLGVAAGVAYDLLRTVRLLLRSRAADWICDALFCIGCACGLFALGLSVGEGRQRGFLTVFVFLGMALYFFTLSIPVRMLLERLVSFVVWCVQILLRPVKVAFKAMKKIEKNVKNLFHYSSKWVILNKSSLIPLTVEKEYLSRAPGKRGNVVEVQKGRYFY